MIGLLERNAKPQELVPMCVVSIQELDNIMTIQVLVMLAQIENAESDSSILCLALMHQEYVIRNKNA